MRPIPKTPEALAQQASDFNAKHVVGTKVRFKDALTEFEGHTRGAAFVLGGHSAVVQIEGRPGSYGLRFITVL